jgi:hypothetical protein
LLGRGPDKPFLMEDIVEIRSHLHNPNEWLTEHRGHNLTSVVEILSGLLHPDEELGSPRNPASFYFGVDSDVEESSPTPGPGRKKHKAGGRKPITKKRRRVKRKIRTSRRNR